MIGMIKMCELMIEHWSYDQDVWTDDRMIKMCELMIGMIKMCELMIEHWSYDQDVWTDNRNDQYVWFQWSLPYQVCVNWSSKGPASIQCHSLIVSHVPRYVKCWSYDQPCVNWWSCLIKHCKSWTDDHMIKMCEFMIVWSRCVNWWIRLITPWFEHWFWRDLTDCNGLLGECAVIGPRAFAISSPSAWNRLHSSRLICVIPGNTVSLTYQYTVPTIQDLFVQITPGYLVLS